MHRDNISRKLLIQTKAQKYTHIQHVMVVSCWERLQCRGTKSYYGPKCDSTGHVSQTGDFIWVGFYNYYQEYTLWPFPDWVVTIPMKKKGIRRELWGCRQTIPMLTEKAVTCCTDLKKKKKKAESLRISLNSKIQFNWWNPEIGRALSHHPDTHVYHILSNKQGFILMVSTWCMVH